MSTTISRVFQHISPKIVIAAFALMLLSILALSPTHAAQAAVHSPSDRGDRPSISDVERKGDHLHVSWQSDYQYDFYILRWTDYHYYYQHEYDGYQAYVDYNSDYSEYSFYVRGCYYTSHDHHHYSCSNWSDRYDYYSSH